jgi:predicted ATP-grasp superfamily ATP-dependent carboligase
MSIFVTESSYKHALGIVRSLGLKNLMVDVGTPSSRMPLASFSKYCRKSYLFPDPRANLNGFVYFFRSMCKVSDCEVIIPVGGLTTFYLSMNKKAIGDDVALPIADFASLKIAANKRDSVLLAEKLGIPTPKTFFLHSSSELDNIDGKRFPIVVKGVFEGGSVRYAYSRNDLKKKFEEIHNLQGVPPLVQEFVQGEGYGFFALFNRGKPKAVFMHRRLRELCVMGGPSTCAESVYDNKLLGYGLKLLKTLEWHGVAMVEFKKDSKDGMFKLMEINPKFWGSLDLAIASGVDFPYLLYKMAKYGDVSPVFHYRRGVKFMWPFPDDLLHVLNKTRDLKFFFSDILNPNVNKNLRIHDLGPTLSQVPEGISFVFSRLTHKRG